jgi:protein SCO1
MLRALMLTMAAAAAVPLHAHDGAHDPAKRGSAASTLQAADAHSGIDPRQRAARLFFSDRKLVTQHGKEVSFYTDVLQGKVVLINFVFTRCADACPMQSATLAAVQSLLADAVGRDVFLVSISVDPVRDTPQVLNEYASRFGAGDGWSFLTGAKANVDEVVRRLGQLTPTAESHTTLFILGNTRNGRWIKLHPDSSPDSISRHLRALASESVTAATAATR